MERNEISLPEHRLNEPAVCHVGSLVINADLLAYVKPFVTLAVKKGIQIRLDLICWLQVGSRKVVHQLL